MNRIRAVIANDSIRSREELARLLAADPELEVVGEARHGLEAVQLARALRPDVVLMTPRLPRLDGLEATRQIMAEAPTSVVMVSDGAGAVSPSVTRAMLLAGATAVLSPPAAEGEEGRRHFVVTVKAMAKVKVVRRWTAGLPAQRAALPRSGRFGTRPRLVAMAASTGGPSALARIFAQLPKDYPLPILVVQHIARCFVGEFAHWLASVTSLEVKVARGGERLQGGTVYLPADDHHLEVGVDRTRVALSEGPAVNGFRPSADVLFASAARSYGRSVVAVMLTGMGTDGVEGLREVRAAGGRVLVQDEASSVVFGMPGAAMAAGLADAALPLDGMAGRLRDLAWRDWRLAV